MSAVSNNSSNNNNNQHSNNNEDNNNNSNNYDDDKNNNDNTNNNNVVDLWVPYLRAHSPFIVKRRLNTNIMNTDYERDLFTSSTDTSCPLWQSYHSPSHNWRSSIPDYQRLRQLVNRLLSVNIAPAAVRTVASDDTLRDITSEVLECLQSIQLTAPSNIEIIPIPAIIPYIIIIIMTI